MSSVFNQNEHHIEHFIFSPAFLRVEENFFLQSMRNGSVEHIDLSDVSPTKFMPTYTTIHQTPFMLTADVMIGQLSVSGFFCFFDMRKDFLPLIQPPF